MVLDARRVEVEVCDRGLEAVSVDVGERELCADVRYLATYDESQVLGSALVPGPTASATQASGRGVAVMPVPGR